MSIAEKASRSRATFRVAIGVALAAAIAVAIVFLAPRLFRGRSASNAGGSTAPRWQFLPGVVTALHSTSFPLSVAVGRDGDLVILQPKVSVRPVTITIAWDPRVLSVVAVTGATDEKRSGDSQVTWPLATPADRGSVTLRARGAQKSAEVRVFAGTREVIRGNVPLE